MKQAMRHIPSRFFALCLTLAILLATASPAYAAPNLGSAPNIADITGDVRMGGDTEFILEVQGADPFTSAGSLEVELPTNTKRVFYKGSATVVRNNNGVWVRLVLTAQSGLTPEQVDALNGTEITLKGDPGNSWTVKFGKLNLGKTTITNTITGIEPNWFQNGPGWGIPSVNVGDWHAGSGTIMSANGQGIDLEIRPTTVLDLQLCAGMFKWEDELGNIVALTDAQKQFPVTANQLSTANIKVRNTSPADSSRVFKSVDLLSDGTIRAKAVDHYAASTGRPVDTTFYLEDDGKKVDETAFKIYGTLENEELELDKHAVSAEIYNGQVIKATGSGSIELTFADAPGFSLTTRMHEGQTYFVQATQELTEGDAKLVERFGSIDSVIKLYSLGLPAGASAVFASDSPAIVYGTAARPGGSLELIHAGTVGAGIPLQTGLRAASAETAILQDLSGSDGSLPHIGTRSYALVGAAAPDLTDGGAVYLDPKAVVYTFYLLTEPDEAFAAELGIDLSKTGEPTQPAPDTAADTADDTADDNALFNPNTGL